MVEQLQKAIEITIEKRIDPGIKETQEHQQEARYNLNRSTEKFILNLTNSALDEIDQFKSDLGKTMYAHIEKNIEDNECERIFKNELIQGIEILCGNIKRRFKECEKRFDEEIKEAIKRLEYRIKDSLAMLERIGIDRGFNLNFDTDSGIDTIGLFSSIGGLVLLLMMPIVGEFALIAGVGLALVGIGKSVWGFFDSDYKKSQQRKKVDEKLDEACEKITEDMKSRIESYKKGVLGMIEELKTELNGPVENYEYKKERLKEADKKLGYISNDIKTRSMQ